MSFYRTVLGHFKSRGWDIKPTTFRKLAESFNIFVNDFANNIKGPLFHRLQFNNTLGRLIKKKEARWTPSC